MPILRVWAQRWFLPEDSMPTDVVQQAVVHTFHGMAAPKEVLLASLAAQD